MRPSKARVEAWLKEDIDNETIKYQGGLPGAKRLGADLKSGPAGRWLAGSLWRRRWAGWPCSRILRRREILPIVLRCYGAKLAWSTGVLVCRG